jgi:uncharacterized RDD family membrane protein YckC
MGNKVGLSKRILAGLIDYSIIITFHVIFIYSYGDLNDAGEYTINGLKSLVPVLFWAIMTIGTEQWLGATFGNKTIGIKPVSMLNNELSPTINQSIKRHLLDPVDMFFFGLVGIITIKNTRHNQRLGDIWAHTVVIKN